MEDDTDDLPDEPILFQAQHQMDYEYNVDPNLNFKVNLTLHYTLLVDLFIYPIPSFQTDSNTTKVCTFVFQSQSFKYKIITMRQPESQH